MGKAKGREMLFWTKAEYLKFADAMMDKPLSYYAVSYTHLDVYKRQVKCLGVHGTVNFEKALNVSCNSAFAQIAIELGLPKRRRRE